MRETGLDRTLPVHRPARYLPPSLCPKLGENLPRDPPIQAMNGEQVKDCDHKTEEAEHCEDQIDRTKARVAESRSPSDQRNEHQSLRNDATPGNHTMVKLRPRCIESGESKYWIDFDRQYAAAFTLGEVKMSCFVEQQDAVIAT